MQHHYPIESLLRSPVEWYSALSLSGSASLMCIFPHVFLLTPRVASILGFGLMLLSAKRFQQGYGIYRYQKNLKRLPLYVLSSKEIPKYPDKLFLGRGFLWTAKHTQRLRDCQMPHNAAFINSSRGY